MAERGRMAGGSGRGFSGRGGGQRGAGNAAASSSRGGGGTGYSGGPPRGGGGNYGPIVPVIESQIQKPSSSFSAQVPNHQNILEQSQAHSSTATIIRPGFLISPQGIITRTTPLIGVSKQVIIEAMKRNMVTSPSLDGIVPSKKTKLSEGGRYEQNDIELEWTCPVCFDIFTEPHVTPCGHTYCYECILSLIPVKPKCPVCDAPIKKEFIFPNRTLSSLIKKKKEQEGKTEIVTAAASVPNTDPLQDLDIHSFLRKKYSDLKLGEVDVLISMLIRKKKILLTESEEVRHALILEFLTELHKRKEFELEELKKEMDFIQTDLSTAKAQMEEFIQKTPENGIEPSNSPQSTENDVDTMSVIFKRPSSPTIDLAFNKTNKQMKEYLPSLAQRKLKIHGHFDELSKSYLERRRDRIRSEFGVNVGNSLDKISDLNELKETLVGISRYRGFKVLATLTYQSDVLLNANIVSTIEFDKDREYFGIAGVTKKIKLFEYESVISAAVNMQCPNGEIVCSSKISCISYNQFYKNRLASSDYDGRITVWDATTCSQVSCLNEHERRVWSVDFSTQSPKLLISGSDDCKLKLWSIQDKNSIYTLHTGANICCVKFVPGSSYEFGFGSADHSVHFYDIRSPQEPLRVYEGHKKAVSYVKFASKTQLISASTDSQLKLWDIRRPSVVRSYTGHVNDKNFVGLTTDGSYIACGSENNSVYVYYKEIPNPILSYQFENYRSMIHPVRQDEVSCEFVSAVAWRAGSPIIVAANSQGIVKVLELI